jgi:regulator of sigma D
MSTANAEDTATATPSGVERRAKLHNTIASLITLRQKMMARYAELAGVSSFAMRGVEEQKPDANKLRSFCQVMVDYTAMGHFEVYQRIIEGNERRRAVKEVASEVYPAIEETTDYLVDFNDRFDELEDNDTATAKLLGDLPRLGEIITIRSELEDQILAALQK